MSNIANNRFLQIIIKACSIIFICVAGYIGIAYFGADIRLLCIFWAFLLFWVLLPGAVIQDNLGIRTVHTSTYIVRIFFTGFALNIILYYLSALIGTDLLLYAVGPVVSVIWIIRTVRGSVSSFASSVTDAFKRAPASSFVFTALVFMSSFLATQYSYIAPDQSAFSYIKTDFAYHAGIINALSQGYPPADPWVDGLTIQYHFFSEMLLSIPEKLFSLPSEELLMSGTPYMVAPVFSLALFSFFREFSERKDLAGIYCLMFHFSNMFILKQFPNSWFLYHIYSNINNAGLGISCMLAALPLLKTWDRVSAEGNSRIPDAPKHASSKDSGRTGSREMFLFAVFIMLMTGIKGPVSIVLVGGMIGTVILGAIMRKIDLKTVALTVLAIISFLLIYVYVLGSQHENTTGSSIFNMGEVTDLFFIKMEILDALKGIPHSVGLLILFSVFGIFYITAFLLPFIVGYIRELFVVLTGRKEFSFSRITVYACCLVGFLGMMLLDFSGHSQVYFGFVACVLIPVIAFWFFEDIRESHSAGAKFVRSFFAVCLCLATVTSVMYSYNSISGTYDYYLHQDENAHKYRNVSADEYKGLIWIRDNTDEDALIASDRYYSTSYAEYDFAKRSNNTHFAYAIYSQRRQYLEGSGFSLSGNLDGAEERFKRIEKNNQLYDPANEERGDIARELDVDYVVVSKRFDSVGDLSNEDYELVFSNDGMDIYEVKDAS